MLDRYSAAIVERALAELATLQVNNPGGWLEWRARQLMDAAALAVVVEPKETKVEGREVPGSDNSPRASWETAGSIARRKKTRSGA